MARRSRTPTSVSPLDAVTQLLSERAKYEQWLEDLEAKKASTPTKVFDRVRQDYVTRLQTVMDQLKEHASALEEHASNLSGRLDQLEQAEEEQAEKRAEAELRANVGEMSAGEWDMLSKKLDREIAKLKQDQALISADIKRIQDLLGGVSGKPAEEAKPADVDELEFLKSVVGTSSPAAGTPAPPATVPKATAEAAPITAPAKSVEEAKSAARKPEAPEKVEPTTPPAVAPPPQAAQSGDGSAPTLSKETPRTATAVDSPGALRTSGVVEQPKTLKCTECGAMNYPSEWYCERCGAELTVV